jgi:hypothetical protein
MKNKLIKSIYCLAIMLCFSFSLEAQLPIKNSALTGEWKLILLNGEYDAYSYDCGKKKFHMSDDMFFQFGEAKAEIFEKNTIKEAENSFFKVKSNGDYELFLGSGSVEKGIWKSKAVDKSEEGFIPDTFGNLVLTSNSEPEPFDIIIQINEQQLLLSISTRSGGGLSQEYVFRKDFKGSAFK